MFGKRAKNQSQDQDQDFEGAEAEFTEDFSSQDQPEEGGWGDDQSDAEEGLEPELRDRRRSPLARILPFAALGVIAAGGVGVYYLKFMQPAAQQTATAVIAAAPAEPEVTAAVPAGETVLATTSLDTATEATTETAVPVVAGAPEIVPSDTAMLEPAEPQATETEAVAPAPTDIQQEAALEPAPVETAIEAAPETTAIAEPATETPVDVQAETVAAAEPVVTEPAPVETVAAAPEPAITPVVAPEPAAAAPVETPVVAPVAATTTTPATAAADENLADMSGRMDVLERQIEDLTKAVDRLATQGSGTAATPVDAELKSTVTALQDQVRKLQSELTTVRSSRTAATASTDPAPARPAATRTTTTATTPRARPAATAAAPAPVRWVLRAAQSNEAWVSRSSEGELRSVTVGQSLEGIGRVTAIRQSGNGGWEVIGTQGSLRQ